MPDPQLTTPGSVVDELGSYLLGIRDRAVQVGHYQDFLDALANVIVHSARESYDDDLSKIDEYLDQLCAGMKLVARKAKQLNDLMDAAETAPTGKPN